MALHVYDNTIREGGEVLATFSGHWPACAALIRLSDPDFRPLGKEADDDLAAEAELRKQIAAQERKISTSYWPKPIPTNRYDWRAVDDNTYDGAPDSGNRHQVGHGATEQEAIDDLLTILAEDDE